VERHGSPNLTQLEKAAIISTNANASTITTPIASLALSSNASASRFSPTPLSTPLHSSSSPLPPPQSMATSQQQQSSSGRDVLLSTTSIPETNSSGGSGSEDAAAAAARTKLMSHLYNCQRLLRSQPNLVTDTEVKAITKSADDVMNWLEQHADAMPEEIALQRSMFDIRWGPVERKLRAGGGSK